MSFGQLVTIILALSAGAALGIFVLAQRPRSRIHQVFFGFVVGTTTWGIGIVGLFTTHSFFFNQFVFYGAALMLAGMFLFARVFPYNEPIPRRWYWYLLPAALVVVAGRAGLIVQGLRITHSGFVEPVNGPLIFAFVVTSVAYLAATIYMLTKKYRSTSGRAR